MVSLSKRGIRVLGIAESFQKTKGSDSILAAVIMRGDFLVDGCGFEKITVGGLDATEKVISLVEKLERTDIHVILLNGCVISWFNIIDLEEVADKTGLPVICVTYQPSKGIEKYIREYFTGEEVTKRLALYNEMKDRKKILLKTGFEVFVKTGGVNIQETKGILNRFIHQGKIVEPLRVAKLLAHTAFTEFSSKIP
ncbi:MAG: endonuclease dU [Candidatus Ranarchaeia archaeon]|jgi:endonuclease V-like protein UPF0215 family